MMPEQGSVLARCFRIGFGELQNRIIRGDEDDHLVELIDMFDAYFAVCRAKLGHDRVPIVSWETYQYTIDRRRLVAELPCHEYTRAQFDADRARLLSIISAKHGIPESDVERLIREHAYAHSGEDPEEEYIGIMAMARSAGWT